MTFGRFPERLALDLRHCLPDPKVERASLRLMAAATGGVTTPQDRQIANPTVSEASWRHGVMA